MASTINASTSPAAIIQTADGTANLNLQSNGSTVLALTSGGVAVTGTMTVGGNAVLNAGSVVTIAQGGTNNASLVVTAGGVVYTDGSKLVNVGAGTANQILQSNGASAPTWVNASAGGLGGTTVFTSSGTFTIPTGKTVVKVTVVGGGGSTQALSGGSITTCSGGGGGGSAIKYLTGLTPGNTLTVTVAGTTSVGNSGSTSSVASGTQSITTISATGGTVGSRGVLCSGSARQTFVNGGAGSNGDINIPGGLGGTSTAQSSSCGDPGGSSYGGGGGSLLASPISFFGENGLNLVSSLAGPLYGGGANGYVCQSGQGAGTGGATGGAGIVIFEY
jgi:hypothetical protein